MATDTLKPATPAHQNGDSTTHKGRNGMLTPPFSPTHTQRSSANLLSPRNLISVQRRRSSSYLATRTGRSQQHHSGYQISSVQDAVVTLKKRSSLELGAGLSQAITNTTFINFIEWIRSERLASLPHKGSRWDTVLIRAQYFAEQLHSFDTAIQGFAVDSSTAAALGYGHARLLLELGSENSEALDKVFAFFYKCSLSISTLFSRSELLAVTSATREELCMMYSDLLTLVTDVGIRFYKTVHGMVYGSTSLDLLEMFGDTIETFKSRRAEVISEIWAYQIQEDGIDVNSTLPVETLSQWLAPQDYVLATLTRDHTTFTNHMAEFTCLWFQKHLSRFLQASDKKFLLVNGPTGSGKTVLAAAIAERLQRPIGKKSFATLFCSITGGIPTNATSVNVVKSLLYQLLNLRIGDMAIYRALVEAYEHSRHCSSLEAYEEHLWTAFGDALTYPSENSKELVLVIDGLSELSGGQAAVDELLKKLIAVASEGRGVKLITLSQSQAVPSQRKDGSVLEITAEDIREDIYAVIHRSLKHCHLFHVNSGSEQESILGRIIQAANGSFLWAILACEILTFQKSKEAFAKTLTTLENPQTSIQTLTLTLLQELNPSNDAKTVLAWLLDSERPFTFAEIRTLFAVNASQAVISDTEVDVHSAVKAIGPLLSIHENIVRIRHLEILRTMKNLIAQGKATMPIKDAEMDLLLRTVAYMKAVLKEKREPSLDDFDLPFANHLYNQHNLLDYAVRYWAIHLKQSSVFQKQKSDFALTDSLKKALPDTPTLAILEKLCWEAEFPTPQALEMHIMVACFRKQALTENSPIVLQTYITLTSCYRMVSNETESSNYCFMATKICRGLLGEFHSLTVECAKRFLLFIESITFTKRTELVTRKEEVLKLLIKAYHHQYGATSELRIQMETSLAELYTSIQEEERATEIYIRIQEATIQRYGKNSKEARGAEEHFHIVLGKTRGKHDVDTYKEHVFHEEEEIEVVEVIDISHIEAIILRAETFIAQGTYVKAEQTYIELWQQVSSRCRSSRGIEWHEKNIEVALSYAKFLQKQKRETESTAVLTCLWQEYEYHDLSYSETIVSQLTRVAKFMKTMGQLTTALTIFKHASSYYKNARKEETKSFIEIEQEITTTSLEVVKRSLSTTTETETNTTSRTTSKSTFQSIISNTSKTIDSTTMILAKKLTTEYMHKQEWSEAISIIELTFRRTWSSFFSESVHSVTTTSHFLSESFHLAEKLADCYLSLGRQDKVEDVYIRLFRALRMTKETELIERAKSLLVGFYDKHGFPVKAIGVFQEVLVIYKKSLGESHNLTIQTLYTLGSRCRSHSRNHLYWIEYYQQILTILNKNSDVCHRAAIDAILVVATYYWEDRRFAEAMGVYTVLWNTFLNKTKEYKVFSEAQLVKEMYERYFYCLEETRTEVDVLYEVTSEYRQACISAFGASAAISIDATLSLAQVSQRSEKYYSQTISLYEEVCKISTTSAFQKSKVKETLLKLYTRQITSTTTTKVTKEAMERAVSIQTEQFSSAKSIYGYLSTTTLTQMQQLLILYSKESKTDLIVKETVAAVTEIATKETSAQNLLQYASVIVDTFRACHQEALRAELVEEIHCQMVAKYARSSSKFSTLSLSKCGRLSLAFLAGLQYHLRSDLQLTFSEIMADLISESFHFETVRRLMESGSTLDKIIIAAAPLRSFLIRKKRRYLADLLERDIINLFIKHDCAKLNLRSKDSPSIFILAILEYLGQRSKADFVRAVIQSSNDKIADLIDTNRIPETHDVASCAFLFALKHNGYTGSKAISQGFKLALLLASVEKCADQSLHNDLLQLSNRIVKEILNICKQQQINFAQVQLCELNDLVILLGRQKDYETLEWLLSTLWNTRDAQRSWPAQVLQNLGRRLICARYLAGHFVQAVRLCEDIAYNTRRVHGMRNPVTLDTYQLLSQLYTSVGDHYQKNGNKASQLLAQQYFKKALAVHEDLLKAVVYDGVPDDDDDELESTTLILSQHGILSRNGSIHSNDPLVDSGYGFESTDGNSGGFVKEQLQLLKYSYQRVGGWPKQYSEYERLNADLFAKFSDELKGTEGVEKWSAKGFGAGKAESGDGAFPGCANWEFAAEHKGNNGVAVGGEL